MGIHRSAETAFVHAAKERRVSCEHLVEEATSRIVRSRGKLLVAMILIDRARRSARSRNRNTEGPWLPSA
jgi:hypothetical protein